MSETIELIMDYATGQITVDVPLWGFGLWVAVVLFLFLIGVVFVRAERQR